MTRTLITTLTLVLLWAGSAQAETRIEVDDIRFDTPTGQDFREGEIELNRRPVFWESDAAWQITIESLDPDLGVSNNGSYVKALSDLQWRLTEGRTWYELRQEPQEVTSGNPGEGSFTMNWRVLLDITKDRPGRYRAELRFTISGV